MPQLVSGTHLADRIAKNQETIAKNQETIEKKEQQDTLIATYAANHGKSAYFKFKINQENATQNIKESNANTATKTTQSETALVDHSGESVANKSEQALHDYTLLQTIDHALSHKVNARDLAERKVSFWCKLTYMLTLIFDLPSLNLNHSLIKNNEEKNYTKSSEFATCAYTVASSIYETIEGCTEDGTYPIYNSKNNILTVRLHKAGENYLVIAEHKFMLDDKDQPLTTALICGTKAEVLDALCICDIDAKQQQSSANNNETSSTTASSAADTASQIKAYQDVDVRIDQLNNYSKKSMLRQLDFIAYQLQSTSPADATSAADKKEALAALNTHACLIAVSKLSCNSSIEHDLSSGNKLLLTRTKDNVLNASIITNQYEIRFAGNATIVSKTDNEPYSASTCSIKDAASQTIIRNRLQGDIVRTLPFKQKRTKTPCIFIDVTAGQETYLNPTPLHTQAASNRTALGNSLVSVQEQMIDFSDQFIQAQKSDATVADIINALESGSQEEFIETYDTTYNFNGNLPAATFNLLSLTPKERELAIAQITNMIKKNNDTMEPAIFDHLAKRLMSKLMLEFLMDHLEAPAKAYYASLLKPLPIDTIESTSSDNNGDIFSYIVQTLQCGANHLTVEGLLALATGMNAMCTQTPTHANNLTTEARTAIITALRTVKIHITKTVPHALMIVVGDLTGDRRIFYGTDGIFYAKCFSELIFAQFDDGTIILLFGNHEHKPCSAGYFDNKITNTRSASIQSVYSDEDTIKIIAIYDSLITRCFSNAHYSEFTHSITTHHGYMYVDYTLAQNVYFEAQTKTIIEKCMLQQGIKIVGNNYRDYYVIPYKGTISGGAEIECICISKSQSGYLTPFSTVPLQANTGAELVAAINACRINGRMLSDSFGNEALYFNSFQLDYKHVLQHQKHPQGVIYSCYGHHGPAARIGNSIILDSRRGEHQNGGHSFEGVVLANLPHYNTINPPLASDRLLEQIKALAVMNYNAQVDTITTMYYDNQDLLPLNLLLLQLLNRQEQKTTDTTMTIDQKVFAIDQNNMLTIDGADQQITRVQLERILAFLPIPRIKQSAEIAVSTNTANSQMYEALLRDNYFDALCGMRFTESKIIASVNEFLESAGIGDDYKIATLKNGKITTIAEARVAAEAAAAEEERRKRLLKTFSGTSNQNKGAINKKHSSMSSAQTKTSLDE